MAREVYRFKQVSTTAAKGSAIYFGHNLLSNLPIRSIHMVYPKRSWLRLSSDIPIKKAPEKYVIILRKREISFPWLTGTSNEYIIPATEQGLRIKFEHWLEMLCLVKSLASRQGTVHQILAAPLGHISRK
jgi:hypothetical protein